MLISPVSSVSEATFLPVSLVISCGKRIVLAERLISFPDFVQSNIYSFWGCFQKWPTDGEIGRVHNGDRRLQCQLYLRRWYAKSEKAYYGEALGGQSRKFDMENKFDTYIEIVQIEPPLILISPLFDKGSIRPICPWIPCRFYDAYHLLFLFHTGATFCGSLYSFERKRIFASIVEYLVI